MPSRHDPLLSAQAPTGTPVVPSIEGTPEWEYEVIRELGSDLKDHLNALGKEGWVLVATEPAFIFRRPRSETKKSGARVGFSY